MLDSEHPPKIQEIVSEDRISSLPDDLLLQILVQIPTKTAVSTMFLSKRWRFVWTMLPRLSYKDTKNHDEESLWYDLYLYDESESKNVWWFLNESMRLHNAPLLNSLHIELGPQCPVDVDVVKWIAKALDRRLCHLFFELLYNSEPIRMPSSLYTCKTLTTLTLSHKILVDVPCSVSLPSLTKLALLFVVYKDEDSHVRLLSSCPVLKWLHVKRHDTVDDNVRKFTVKVPSLQQLTYLNKVIEKEEEDDGDVSLVINTPALEYLNIQDILARSGSIEYMPHLVEASITVEFYPNGNILRSLSSINCMRLFLVDKTAMWWSSVNYSQLRECIIGISKPLYESVVVLLSNCPKLEAFMVESYVKIYDEPISWNQPSSVPKCMLSTLKIFKWVAYLGREDEKGLVSYIIGNSRCLTTVEVTVDSTIDSEDEKMMIADLNIQASSIVTNLFCLRYSVR